MIFSPQANQDKYPFTLMELPYDKNAFKEYMQPETFDYHHGKHHLGYVNNLNRLLEKKQDQQKQNLEGLIISSGKDENMRTIFNNAAQIWNHNFFWHSIAPNGKRMPEGALLDAINKKFGSYEAFITEFKSAALAQFGSGWCWLICNHNLDLQIITTSNADTPIKQNQIPILTCDVWEHAYYIDHRNDRAKYLNIFIENLVNWRFAEGNFSRIMTIN